ncbi:transcriptional regulator [Amycolatopsis antarctica]|uniref:Transcriptional regulator n=1 Tax=Amycolatopsis antarctica TaxID=1854586 RepID=A0A263D090_9PSEU|nr:winged helix-turn-helix domain-containing protein [Amycolatopsis antarctica]OZM71842.1 transcriptional regulator [Amycolatopsis antarctica]
MPLTPSSTAGLIAGHAEVTFALRVTVRSEDAPRVAASLRDTIAAIADRPGTEVRVDGGDAVPPIPHQRRQPPLRIDPGARRVIDNGHEPVLTRLEYDLLLHLCRNPRLVHSRRRLLREVWRLDEPGNPRTVDVHIRRLRSKLGSAAALITTVRGVGYRLDRPELVHIDATD